MFPKTGEKAETMIFLLGYQPKLSLPNTHLFVPLQPNVSNPSKE